MDDLTDILDAKFCGEGDNQGIAMIDIKRYHKNVSGMLEESANGDLMHYSDHLAIVEEQRKTFEQIVTDPENQPSQYGTIPLSMHEAAVEELRQQAKGLEEALAFLSRSALWRRYGSRKIATNEEAILVNAINNALAALSQPVAGVEGWKMVPKEPTQAMCDAARVEAAHWQNSGDPWSAMTWFRIYRAMIAVAPAPAAPQEAEPFPERDPNIPAEQQGLFRKFIVHRVDGSDAPGGKHYGCRYFVLDLNHDKHAPAAMRAYAADCAATHPKLALDLFAEFGAAPRLQETGPISEQNARFAIEAAIDFGRQGINPPPSDDHWLTPYWKIGKQHAAPAPQAQVSDADLPALPFTALSTKESGSLYTADDMFLYAKAAISALLSRSDDARDAARYRWLRKDWVQPDPLNRWVPRSVTPQPNGSVLFSGVYSEREYDIAVDRAMQSEQEGGK